MNLETTLDKIYGPLPKSYCLYFKILAIFTFVMLALSLMGLVYGFMTGKSFISVGNSQVSFGLALALIVGYFVEYITARLLHTMCIKAL
uniref:Uncharacterized protein n=1 Tax=viral metagenome TaxID=1070528 RepID=A0A6C0HIA8_9ZZZZ